MTVTGRGILSPLRLPISPPRRCVGERRGRKRPLRDLSAQGSAHKWRPGSESNRRTRLCRPLHDHSATWPSHSAASLAACGTKNKTSACPRFREHIGVACYGESHGRTPIIRSRNWSGKRDSNSRPRPWQGRALPTELFPREPHIIRLAARVSTSGGRFCDAFVETRENCVFAT